MQFFAQHGWLAVGAVLLAILYAGWVASRLYMALGSCPKCQRRLHRAAAICDHCGCRRHEYQPRR